MSARRLASSALTLSRYSPSLKHTRTLIHTCMHTHTHSLSLFPRNTLWWSAARKESTIVGRRLKKDVSLFLSRTITHTRSNTHARPCMHAHTHSLWRQSAPFPCEEASATYFISSLKNFVAFRPQPQFFGDQGTDANATGISGVPEPKIELL